MKTKLLALLFLVGSAAFAAPRVVVGVGVGRLASVLEWARAMSRPLFLMLLPRRLAMAMVMGSSWLLRSSLCCSSLLRTWLCRPWLLRTWLAPLSA